MITTHLRTVTNHWCSFSRFGRARKACWFCGILSDNINDRVQHTIKCKSFSDFFLQTHRLQYNLLDLETLLRFRHCGHPLSRHGCHIVMYYILIAFRVFNSCRHGSICSKRLVVHATRQIVATSSPIWKLRKDILLNGYGFLLEH